MISFLSFFHPRSFFSSFSSPFTRAQITIEWLMLALIALSLISLATMAVMRTYNSQATLTERRILQMEVREMAYYADQICALGAGNSQAVQLASIPIHLEYDSAQGLLKISKAGASTAAGLEDFQSSKTLCKINVDPQEGYTNMAYLYYEAGSDPPAVRISSQPP